MPDEIDGATGVRPFLEKLMERRRRGLLPMEEACFGTSDPHVIWGRTCEFVEALFGAAPAAVCHYSVSIGAVLGLDLVDGRRVALKVFAPWHDPQFLQAANAVRDELVATGYPAPPSLSGVVSFGRAHAWVEQWVEAPPPAAADDVVVVLADHLADFLRRCTQLRPDRALTRSWQTYERPVSIWRNPPRPDADLDVEVPGADWIREIAEFGRSVADAAPGPRVLGHVDWRPDNIRVSDDGTLRLVLDWDSVQLTHRVHVLAGACTGLRPSGVALFLDAYQTASGVALSPDERRAVAGRVVWSHALWARFELVRNMPEPELRFVRRLAQDRDEYLAAV